MSKTKQLIIAFRKDNCVHDALLVKDETVQTVTIYKYLVVYIADRLSLIENMCTKNVYNVCVVSEDLVM